MRKYKFQCCLNQNFNLTLNSQLLISCPLRPTYHRGRVCFALLFLLVPFLTPTPNITPASSKVMGREGRLKEVLTCLELLELNIIISEGRGPDRCWLLLVLLTLLKYSPCPHPYQSYTFKLLIAGVSIKQQASFVNRMPFTS